MQILPHPSIAPIVRHYLLLRGTLAQESIVRLFADGNTGLVFNLGDSSLHTGAGVASYQRSWVYGQMSTFRDLVLGGELDCIIVVLQPYGAHQLWGEMVNDWKDQFISGPEVLGKAIDRIGDQLQRASSVADTVKLLNAWIIDLAGNKRQPDTLLLKAVQLINTTGGQMPVHGLLDQLQVNERLLERKFSAGIGISPKQYAGIVRITASAKGIRRLQQAGQLTGVAYDHDYFDQAHFIKDFKKYTGITPWQYQHQVSPLALNFLRF